MPAYDYTALKPGSKAEVRGRIEADTERDARAKLRARGETPLAVEAVSVGTKGFLRLAPAFMQRRCQREVFLFTTQLSTLIRSGITLTEAIRVLAAQGTHREFSNALNLVFQSIVEKGWTFASALREFPLYFPPIYVSMVKAGESTGNLSAVLDRLASYAKKREMLENRIRSALTYPAVMCTFGSLIVIFLLSHLVPRIIPLLQQQKKALPLATTLLIQISNAVGDWWWLGLVAVVAGIAVLRAAYRSKRGRLFLDGLLLRMPVFGELNRKAAVSRFCITLSSLLRSGVKIEEAMAIVEEVAGNAVVAETIRAVSARIREGESIATPLARSKVFPPVVTYMISVGEKAGSDELQEMLDRISESYDVEIENAAERLTAVLSPLLLIGLAGIVVFILIAILMPIMSLSQIKM